MNEFLSDRKTKENEDGEEDTFLSLTSHLNTSEHKCINERANEQPTDRTNKREEKKEKEKTTMISFRHMCVEI